MASERQVIDIDDVPELLRLVDEARASHRALLLQRAGEDLAMIVPLVRYPITPVPPNPALDAALAGEPEDSVVRRTAGALHTDQPFVGYEEEKEAAMRGMALEAVAAWDSDDSPSSAHRF
jgi:hypothetical protein